jgi:hypothetical protein
VPHGVSNVSIRSGSIEYKAVSIQFVQQICRLEIESYGSPSTDIIYQWNAKPAVWEPKKIQLPDFVLDDVLVNRTQAVYATGI